MSTKTGKLRWVTPRLEEIAMVDTAMKGTHGRENFRHPEHMPPTGMQS